MTNLPEENPPKRRIKTDTILSISSILITLIYGCWGVSLTNRSNDLNTKMLALATAQIKLSEKQDSTSVDLNHFAELLVKTDSVISLSDSQLLLNKDEQKVANSNYKNSEIGNMNELESKIFQIQNLYYNDVIHINPSMY